MNKFSKSSKSITSSKEFLQLTYQTTTSYHLIKIFASALSTESHTTASTLVFSKDFGIIDEEIFDEVGDIP